MSKLNLIKMKKMYFALMAVAGLTLASCGGAETPETVEVTYGLDAKATTLAWTGKYVSDGHTHNGTVDVTEGTVVYNGDEFVSGNFTVDLNTMVDLDMPAPMSDTLISHLKGGYFFNTAEYANVPVVINSISDKEITATMTVAGKEIKAVMPLKISKDDKKMTASGKFDIDFASVGMGGMNPTPGKPENERVETVISFDLNLVLNKQ